MGIDDKKCWHQGTGAEEWYIDFINDLPKHKQAQLSGLGLGPMVEPYANFLPARCEHVIENADAYIVLGRDRAGGMALKDDGYGVKGCSGAHSIDLVVGRNAAVEFGIQKTEGLGPDGKPKGVNPDFKTDAARVYISQKSDIDNYFGIDSIDTATMPPAMGKSAVGIKADNVRIVAREGVRIVSAYPDEYNSQGTKHADGKSGVYLVYGTGGDANHELQPMVRGNNLLEALTATWDAIGKLVDWASSTNQTIVQLCGALGAHTHICTAPGSPSGPSIEMLPAVFGSVPVLVKDMVGQGVAHSTNDAAFRVNQLQRFGGKYILSHWHKLN